MLSAGYFLFFFVVLIPVAGFSMQRRSQEAKLFFAGLTRMYLVGLTGYVLVPAGGPFMAFPDVFPYPVQGGPIAAFLAGVVAKGITGMDVFPSLHAGIGAYVLGFFALGGYRRIALLLLPVVVALIVATIYLRYHYGIDVLCGLALAATVLVFVQRFRKESPRMAPRICLHSSACRRNSTQRRQRRQSGAGRPTPAGAAGGDYRQRGLSPIRRAAARTYPHRAARRRIRSRRAQ